MAAPSATRPRLNCWHGSVLKSTRRRFRVRSSSTDYEMRSSEGGRSPLPRRVSSDLRQVRLPGGAWRRKQTSRLLVLPPSIRRELGLRAVFGGAGRGGRDRKSTRLNSSHRCISYAVF